MPGNVTGGRRARDTNLARYDAQYRKEFNMGYYEYLGHLGGKVSRGGGFAAGEEGRKRARIAGAVGGRKSRRVKASDSR